MSRLCKHLVGQRSFYPLYPPAIGAMLDCNSALNTNSINKVPDIMLLPSDLAVFAKRFEISSPLVEDSDLNENNTRENMMDTDIESNLREGSLISKKLSKRIICLNPGRLSRGAGAGTWVAAKVLGRRMGTMEE